MNITSIRNKLIIYKTYGNLSKELVEKIQTDLMTKTKSSDFEDLLKKVENEVEK